MLAHRPGEVLRHCVTQRLLAGGTEADAGLEHLARDLAGAEARQVDLLGDRLESTVDVVLELVLVDLDVQLDLVALEGFQRTLHRSASVSAGAPVRPAVGRPSCGEPSDTDVRATASTGQNGGQWSTGSRTQLAKPHAISST